MTPILLALALQTAPAAVAAPATTPATLAERLFDAMAREDLPAAAALFAPGAEFVLPYNPDGDASPAGVRRFPAMGYVTVATRSYDDIRFRNRAATPAADGATLFVEAEGDLVNAATGRPYRNRYVFKFETKGGRITRVTEYANTVTLAAQGVAARAPAR